MVHNTPLQLPVRSPSHCLGRWQQTQIWRPSPTKKNQLNSFCFKISKLTNVPHIFKEYSSNCNTMMLWSITDQVLKWSYPIPYPGFYVPNKTPKMPLDQWGNHLPFSDTQIACICTETESCLVLSTICCLTYSGWTDTHKHVHYNVGVCRDMRHEVTTNSGLQLKDPSIVIPASLRKSFLTDLHEGHPGITKTPWTTCILIYWSGMDKDIEDYIKRYPSCIKLQPTQLSKPLIGHKVSHGLGNKLMLTSWIRTITDT